MKVLPRDEFDKFVYDRDISKGLSRERALNDIATLGGGITLWPEGEIVLSEGARTRTKLHELGHKAHGKVRLDRQGADWPEWTWGDTVYNEMLAEKYAWELKGKKITHRIGMPAIRTLIYDENCRPREAVAVVLQVLNQHMGIRAGKKEKEELLRWAKRYGR